MKLLPVFFIQALSQFSGECPPIRQYLRMGNSVRQYCSQLDRKCTFKCSNGLRNGDPENVSCKGKIFNPFFNLNLFKMENGMFFHAQKCFALLQFRKVRQNRKFLQNDHQKRRQLGQLFRLLTL